MLSGWPLQRKLFIYAKYNKELWLKYTNNKPTKEISLIHIAYTYKYLPQVQMFDFKMCLLDLIKLQVNPKPRKSLKEISCRYSSDFMKKYNEINIIHFNENMSMVSKLNNMKYGHCPGQFKASPIISNAFSNTSNCSQKRSIREWGVETVCFDFSSDDRETLTPTTSTSADSCASGTSLSSARSMTTDDSHFTFVRKNDRNNYGDGNGLASSPLDSFCTLCTSSFSFSNCNNCEKSGCGSKCSGEDNGSQKDLKVNNINQNNSNMVAMIRGNHNTISSDSCSCITSEGLNIIPR